MAARPFRILIADDHVGICRGVRSLLETDKAWQVVGEAYDGREALRLARALEPDIAILDYSLPLLNGLELTRAIRQDLPKTEILIFTMHDRESIISEVLRAGARGYVLKADGTDHLMRAVEALSRRMPYFSGSVAQTVVELFLDDVTDISGKPVLSPREREVLQLVAEGQTSKQIAYALGISIRTVHSHRTAVMHKLKLKTTAELVRYAVRDNIVLP